LSEPSPDLAGLADRAAPFTGAKDTEMARCYCEIGGAGDPAAATGGGDGGDADCDAAAGSDAFPAADFSDGAGASAGIGG